MTVSSTTNRSGPYTGNGVTTEFAYGFRILAAGQVQVVRTEAGVDSIVEASEYSVSGVGDPTGSVTFSVAPTSAQTITLIRNAPFTQQVDLENQGAYYAETIEEAFDLAAMRDQQLQEQVDRAVVIPVGADASSLDGLITDILRLGVSADEIDTVANISADVSTVAGIALDVSTVAGVSTEVAALGPVADDIPTVASVVSDIPTVAANVTDITNFADVYQGPKAVAPATRNNGSALVVGDLYFDTVSEQMFVWGGAEWQPTFLTGNTVRSLITATAGQTVFTVPVYIVGANTLSVFVNGLRVLLGDDYTETDQNTITFTAGLAGGDELEFIVLQPFAIGTTGAESITTVYGVTLARLLELKEGTVAGLIADTTLNSASLPVGSVIEAGGFSYEVAAPDATDQHVTTAGGVKLYEAGPFTTAARLKRMPTANLPSGYPATVAGTLFRWDASVAADRARADLLETVYISPNLSSAGAWVRATLDGPEAIAINRALNERPYEAPPEAVDAFNAVIPVAPAFGRQININSTSEDLTDSHYAYDAGLSRVTGDTITWQGITLQRLTGTTSFPAALRDNRAADYPLTPGRRYIMSAVVCAPFLEVDSFGVKGPWNRFSWMWAPVNATSFGHGAKLIGPVPRRVWQIVEADTTTTVRVIADPSVSLSSSASTVHYWLRNCSARGATIAGADVYVGGLQIEEAPDQSEKSGIAIIGTSIDTGTSSLQHWTQERSWPRYLEGLLSVPIFNGAIGGQNSTQLEARFDTDIAPWGVNAKYCILAANVNDFSSGFSSATYRANWLSMYNKAIAAGMIPIFMTPPRRSGYNYANGAADMAAEIAYIKATYPFVIDRDFVWQDPLNPNLLNSAYEEDGIHPYDGMRELAFMIYHKYRHFFTFENVPGPYQKTGLDNSKVQSFGGPIWAGRYWASRITSVSNTAVRDVEAGTAPILIFEGTQTGAVTYQLPCANYQRAAERVNTDIQVQQIRNATAGGFTLTVQYYKRDVSNTLSTVGSGIGPIPNGETWTVATDGVTAWRVQ
jgi:hypothetical protein